MEALEAAKAAEERVAPAAQAAAVAQTAVTKAATAQQAAAAKHQVAVYKRTRTNKHKKHAANNLRKVGVVDISDVPTKTEPLREAAHEHASRPTPPATNAGARAVVGDGIVSNGVGAVVLGGHGNGASEPPPAPVRSSGSFNNVWSKPKAAVHVAARYKSPRGWRQGGVLEVGQGFAPPPTR